MSGSDTKLETGRSKVPLLGDFGRSAGSKPMDKTSHVIVNLRILPIWLEVLLLTLASLSLSSYGQGAFENLDFEAAVPNSVPLGFIPTSNALPGWAASPYGMSGPVVQTGFVLYNSQELDASAVSVWGPGGGVAPLQGNYSVRLAGSTDGANHASASISQTGHLPQNAQTLVFLARPVSNIPGTFVEEPIFDVTFSGHPIPLFEIASTAAYDVMGGDISGFAGQTGELVFTAAPNHVGWLDDIQIIPEPSSVSLFSAGLLLLGWWCSRNRP